MAAYVHRDGGAATLAVWDTQDRVVRDLAITAGTHFTFERPQWALDGSALLAETYGPVVATEEHSVAPDASGPAFVRVLRSDDDPQDSRAAPCAGCIRPNADRSGRDQQGPDP
ncbi:hypothetical protein GCM10011575_00520 [Microlunatus endophyticus]|uniref:Uncharacterized protein n=1 Tax=Microlunatus endophyticus TaxID=1716077 RepID=A0A917W0A2_9ACTN|nr:hypothetical protein [Microlunatus endophyticus]GGL46456.1 hypothetical protein GCM10011575_00520 [Microlunatus endophyticus]